MEQFTKQMSTNSNVARLNNFASPRDTHAIADAVEAEINDRKRRNTIVPGFLFADPAWDLLLALYRAELRQYKLSVTKLCLHSQVPTTTALRWITILQREGLLARFADQLDGRRYYTRLTDAGSTAMMRYFSAKEYGEGDLECAA